FNKSKGVFITDPKLKALLNPQPSWGFSGHKKDPHSAGFFTKEVNLSLWLSHNFFVAFHFDLYATIWCQAL
ncbi:hypothetical protein AC599_21300, partial [Yersinia pestis subsp. microtus bv. Altaica]